MAGQLRTLLVAAVLSIAIAVISGGRWPHYLMGVAFALALWFILYFSTYGQQGTSLRAVTWPTYAMAAVITLVLGSVFLWIGGRDNGAWWGPAVIMAGTLVWPVGRRADGGEPSSSG